MQAAKTKALDVINSLGLSDSLLRVIERRQSMDKYITYGGMVRFSLARCANDSSAAVLLALHAAHLHHLQVVVVILLVMLWRWLK